MIEKDIVSHVAEILALEPTRVEFTVPLDNANDAWGIIYTSDGNRKTFDVDFAQITFYERLLKRNNIQVRIGLLEGFLL